MLGEAQCKGILKTSLGLVLLLAEMVNLLGEDGRTTCASWFWQAKIPLESSLSNVAALKEQNSKVTMLPGIKLLVISVRLIFFLTFDKLICQQKKEAVKKPAIRRNVYFYLCVIYVVVNTKHTKNVGSSDLI